MSLIFQGTFLRSPQLLARIFKRQLWPKLLNTFLDFQSFNVPNSTPLIRAQMCARGYPASFFEAMDEWWECMKGEIMSQRYQIPWAVNWLTSFCKKTEKINIMSLEVARTSCLSSTPILTRPFYWYGGHIEYIWFKEHYEMPREHSFSIYARFSGKKRTSLYISWEKGDHYYILTRHKRSFFPLQSFSTKSARKYWVNISDRAHAPSASHNAP